MLQKLWALFIKPKETLGSWLKKHYPNEFKRKVGSLKPRPILLTDRELKKAFKKRKDNGYYRQNLIP